MVTLVWGGGEGVLGEGSPPPLAFNYCKEALGGGLEVSVPKHGPNQYFRLCISLFPTMKSGSRRGCLARGHGPGGGGSRY